MTGDMISKGLLTIGNIISNLAKDDVDALKLQPDIVNSGKITRLMSKFIIAPNVVVDESLRYMDAGDFKNLIKTELVTFTAVVTQAFRVLAEIYGVSPELIIDKMGRASRKDYIGDVRRLGQLVNGSESYDFVGDLMLGKDGILPITESVRLDGVQGSSRASEVSNNDYIQKDVASFINSFEIQIQFETNNGNTRTLVIPIIIYPNIMYTNATSLIANMLESDAGKSFMERVHEYKAGVISLSDLILATDLVKKYRHRKISNSNEIANYLNVADKSMAVKDILYNNKHFSKNYNIYVFNIDKKPQIEKQLKGSIFKERYKDKLTETLFAFSVSFVDIEKEEVLIFIDDIPGFSALNFNMLKKEKDNDLKDVIKELMNNRQPF